MGKSETKSWREASARSCRLVGQFIQWWASVEAQLDQAMAAAIGLTGAQRAIVAANIPVAAKINITVTAVEAAGMDEKKTKHYKRQLKKLWGLNDDRNMMVHYLFGPSKDETATQFIVTEARGKLKFPEIIWTRQDFIKRYNQMDALYLKLEELEKELKMTANRIELARLLATEPSPMPVGSALGALSSHLPQPPKRKRSAQIIASSQKSPRTPPTAEG